MSQSLASITIHVVFSTKNRRKYLDAELRPRLFAYIAEVSTNKGAKAHIVGGGFTWESAEMSSWAMGVLLLLSAG